MMSLRRAAPLALGALVGVLHPTIARGDDRPGGRVEEEERRAPHDWALAAGVGFVGLGSAGVGAVGALSPLVALMLERRATEHLWLMGRATGSYGEVEDHHLTGNGIVMPVAQRTAQGGGALGVRWIFNPGRMTELSSFATAGVSYSRSTHISSQPLPGAPPVGIESRTTSLQGQLGASIDRELTDGLGVRLSLVVAQASWSTSDGIAGTADDIQDIESDGFMAGVTLSPTLEMRFSF